MYKDLRIISFLSSFSIALLLLSSAPSSCSEKVRVQGVLDKDQTWSGAILVTGDILVPPSVRLVMLPGTRVYVSAAATGKDLREDVPADHRKGPSVPGWDSEYRQMHFGEPYRDESARVSIIIEGILIADGTEEEPIIITSGSEEPQIYDWNFLRVHEGSLSHVEMSFFRVFEITGPVTVKECVIRDLGECVSINGSGAVFSANTVRDCGFELLSINRSDPLITDNTLGPNIKKSDYQQCASVFVHGGAPVITGNRFLGCQEPGITFCNTDRCFRGTFRSNTVSRDAVISLQCEADKNLDFDLDIGGNNIYSNVIIRPGFRTVALDLSGCYWGAPSPGGVIARIKGLDRKRHTVELSPVLDRPVE